MCHSGEMLPSVAASPRHRFITVYGRTPVLEALRDDSLVIDKVLLAEQARGRPVDEIASAADRRGVPVRRASADRIKKLAGNGRHDQGVLADVVAPRMRVLAEVMQDQQARHALHRVVLVDGVTTPANLGMILRTATAAGMDAVVVPRRGVAGLDPLVVKASAGVAFQAPILHCSTAAEAAKTLAEAGVRLVGLSASAPESLFDADLSAPTALVLGSETDGVGPEVARQVANWVSIPMRSGVESLNVAAAAAVACFELARREGSRP